ncbi:hypothetical protein IJ541_08670 [bacterium]|nr:hypothetical protein [bacterium]MBQ9246913.1 hypothetical protein [bacterium]
MKKFIAILTILLTFAITQSVFAVENIVSYDEIEQEAANIEQQENQTEIPNLLETAIKFDWVDITQTQRDENIETYKRKLFDENTSKIYFTKDEFKTHFAKYFKDKDFKHHYMLTNNGVTKDEDAKYCAFYYKKNTLVMYAIQYNNNPTNAFYYTAFGKLYYTDVMSDEYPNFPYTSMQYNRKGQLKSAIYFVSKDLQYMFGPDKEFQGIWYKDKMYDKNGKQTLTRSNW